MYQRTHGQGYRSAECAVPLILRLRRHATGWRTPESGQHHLNCTRDLRIWLAIARDAEVAAFWHSLQINMGSVIRWSAAIRTLRRAVDRELAACIVCRVARAWLYHGSRELAQYDMLEMAVFSMFTFSFMRRFQQRLSS